jgi:hypothetical protein
MTGTIGQKAERDMLASEYGIDFFNMPRSNRRNYRQEESLVAFSEN